MNYESHNICRRDDQEINIYTHILQIEKLPGFFLIIFKDPVKHSFEEQGIGKCSQIFTLIFVTLVVPNFSCRYWCVRWTFSENTLHC